MQRLPPEDEPHLDYQQRRARDRSDGKLKRAHIKAEEVATYDKLAALGSHLCHYP
eukprot:COSAG02_NODE_41194_length_397_cov_0.724832_1_plen_54_part_10